MKRASRLPSKSSFQVRQGEIIRVETCGGGGYGLAWRRDASSVLRDVIDRKISAARAREAYAVVIDPATGLIDVEQTNSLRESLEQRFRDNSLSVTDAGGTIR